MFVLLISFQSVNSFAGNWLNEKNKGKQKNTKPEIIKIKLLYFENFNKIKVNKNKKKEKIIKK